MTDLTVSESKGKCVDQRRVLDPYSECQFLAPEDPDSRDAAVVVGAEQDNTGKGILSEFVQALEHTCKKTQ